MDAKDKELQKTQLISAALSIWREPNRQNNCHNLFRRYFMGKHDCSFLRINIFS